MTRRRHDAGATALLACLALAGPALADPAPAAPPGVEGQSGLRLVGEFGVGLTLGLWDGTPVSSSGTVPLGTSGLLTAGVAFGPRWGLVVGDQFVYAPASSFDGNQSHDSFVLAGRLQLGANVVELGGGGGFADLLAGYTPAPGGQPVLATASGWSALAVYYRLVSPDQGLGLTLDVSRLGFTSADGAAAPQASTATLVEIGGMYVGVL